MSNDTHINERKQGFEPRDWNAGTVYAFLLGLAVVCLVVYFLLRGMYAYLDAQARASQPAQNPLVAARANEARNQPRTVVQDEIKTTLPEPRLEENERQEISRFRMQEEQTLNSYGWVDQPAGVVHIPIERAMELVAQRGLPTLPPKEAVPSAPVKRKR